LLSFFLIHLKFCARHCLEQRRQGPRPRAGRQRKDACERLARPAPAPACSSSGLDKAGTLVCLPSISRRFLSLSPTLHLLLFLIFFFISSTPWCRFFFFFFREANRQCQTADWPSPVFVKLATWKAPERSVYTFRFCGQMRTWITNP